MRLALVAVVVVLVTAGWRDADVTAPSPDRAAKALVARLTLAAKRHSTSYGASPVVARDGRSWLAFGTTKAQVAYLGGGPGSGVVRIFRWTGAQWVLDGRVEGDDLGPTQWLNGESLTGSPVPDFSIAGCGAGDMNCLSIVSKAGGRWHAVPFEYGYGLSHFVNGVPWNGGVETQVDACGCAGGPSTWTFERYRDGVFRPAAPKGRRPCSTRLFRALADGWEVPVLQFDHAACSGGWGLAVGTGAGFGGKVVGLFDRNGPRGTWQLLTLDAGNALPAAPAIYDLPLALLERLAARFGDALSAEASAARLIAELQKRYDFWWPQQEGIVDAAGARWLVALVPQGRPKHEWSATPRAAIVYRWTGSSWIEDGRIPSVPLAMDLAYYGGWFVSAPASPGAAALGVAGKRLTLTNAGGWWRVER